jgi:solute carrier family 6 GABA transporter-like protein 1
MLQLVTWENLVYQGYHYPWWAHAIGYFMAGSSMICIPAYAAWLWFTTPGTTQEVFKYRRCIIYFFLIIFYQ